MSRCRPFCRGALFAAALQGWRLLWANTILSADEACAVSNAIEELKAAATAVIGSNNEDAVASFLKNRISGILEE